MDLSTLDVKKGANEGAELKLLHPVSGEDTGIRISVVGRDSDLYQQELRRIQNSRIRKGVVTSASRDDGVELLAKCTTGWDGVEEKGSVLEFSEENAKRVYKAYPWIREQVELFMGDRSNFLES